MRKNPNTTETVTTARYGRVLTVTAPAVDGWYPVILSDGTRGYISSQFVVWEKPYDPPKKTTTTKTYIYVSKSGYPKSGWAGNRLKQTQRLNLKSSPKSSSNTVRSVPYATEGVVRGRTSNGYYVSGGNGYQVVYGIESHIIFSKPTKNTTLLSSNDALIVKTSNQKSSTGCCGSGSSKDDIPDKIPNGTTTKTEDPVDVEDGDSYWVKVSVANIRKEPSIKSDILCQAAFQDELEFLGSDENNQWYHVKTGSGKEGWIWHENVTNKKPSSLERVYADDNKEKLQSYADSAGYDVNVLLAIIYVESEGEGFNDFKKVKIRFENHYFYNDVYGGLTDEEKKYARQFILDTQGSMSGHKYRTELDDNAWKSCHKNQQTEYEVFEIAKSINEKAAYQSISMGGRSNYGCFL